MQWLKDRLSEKSTLASLIGVASVSMKYLKIPPDLVDALSGFLLALFCSIAATKG